MELGWSISGFRYALYLLSIVFPCVGVNCVGVFMIFLVNFSSVLCMRLSLAEYQYLVSSTKYFSTALLVPFRRLEKQVAIDAISKVW
jgi:hypothetical protein